MNTKQFITGIELKADVEGAVRAVFSTFDVIDADQDIVLASAFTHGQEVPMVWAHDWSRPVGKGAVLVEEHQAVFDGAFFLDTAAGLDAYRTVKAMGPLQQWSWGFRVLDASYEERDAEWVRVIKRAEVYEVSPVLVGAGVGTHTQSVKTGLPYAEHGETVLAAVGQLLERSKELASLRAKDGRVLSEANRKRLASLHESLLSVAGDLQELLEATDPEKGKRQVDAMFIDFQQTLARMAGVTR